MARVNVDGYFDVRITIDKTQAFVDINPPQGGGRNVAAREIIADLENRGVAYGFHLHAIEEAARHVAETAMPARGILAAEGIMPHNGTDAHIEWRIDAEAVSGPLPRRQDGLPDYFKLDKNRLVRAGQELATVTPGLAGSPGKTLIVPVEQIRQIPGRDAAVIAGGGLHLTPDRLRYVAEVDGVAELHNDRLTIQPLTLIDGDIIGGDHVFHGTLVVLGNVSGATIHSRGPLAVRGSVKNSSLRSQGYVLLTQASKTRIISEEDIHVELSLDHCEVVTLKRFIAASGSRVVGGDVTAVGGVAACHIGSEQWPETEITIGGDVYKCIRLHEIEAEIQVSEENTYRIGAALKPLTSVTSEPMPDGKRKMVQTLLDQKRELEQRAGALHAEKRSVQMTHYPENGKVLVSGTVHPGVSINIYGASIIVEEAQSNILFSRNADGKGILSVSCQAARAA